MSKFGVSQSVSRKEDVRFLSGQGQYVDDLVPEGSAVLLVLRSPVAHAEVKSIDTTAAEAMDGVLAVYTAKDLEGKLKNEIGFSVVENRDGTEGAKPTRPIMAKDRVRFVGEAIAAVVAKTPAIGRDALEAIDVDYDDLPVHTALELGGDVIHPEAPNNRVFDWAYGDEKATEAAFSAAAHRVELDIYDNRIICNSMETRACYAEMQDGGRLHVSFSGQGVWGLKEELAAALGMDKNQIRVTNPDVGGGFGMKAFSYPEYFLAALAAKELDHPIHWVSDRSEAMITDNGGRDLTTKAEAAFDADHKLVALRFKTLANMGAYCSGYAQFIQTDLALKVLTGVYDVQVGFFHVEGVFTNTTPIDAYRGAGRPEAIYQLERLMDYSAKVLGVDQFELRRKNFIPKEAFPYTTFSGEHYDVGDFNRVLDRAMEEADVQGFAARKAESAKHGKLRGLGLSYYIESILGDQNETTKIEFAEDGMVNLYVGTQSNGQGHETVFAQILHARAGIPFEKVRFVQGDSDRIAKGGGTGGSRSVTMQGNSINVCADIMLDRFKPLAEEELEVAASDIVFEDGAFRVAGTDRSVDLMTLAGKARTKGQTEVLSTENEFEVPGRSYPNGAHFAEIEIDPQTGVTSCVKYTIVDDFGLLMNPMLAEGQAHGGVAQGIGQALSENVVYDESGQLLSGTFMDYAMPRADNLPMMPFHAELVPSTANDIGMKGCGEAGTVGALAAVTNAALDAVWEHGVTHIDMPLTPMRMWTFLNTGKIAAE